MKHTRVCGWCGTVTDADECAYCGRATNLPALVNGDAALWDDVESLVEREGEWGALEEDR